LVVAFQDTTPRKQLPLQNALFLFNTVSYNRGWKLPNKTSKWILFKGFIGAKSTLAWKDIENLSEIKKMTDPNVLAAMQIFGSVGAATYFSNQDLMAIMTFKAVQLSIKHGNAPESVILYSAYGLILCSVVGDIDSGFRFGQLALRLLDKFNLPELASQAGHLVNAFINHWKIHLRETLSPLKQAYLIGLETGNFEYAGYGALFFCFHSLFAGIELPEVERRIRNYSRAISRLKHEFSQTFLQIFHQTVVNLKDKVNDPCRLSGTYYDECQRLSTHREANDKTTLANFFFIKLYLNYLFGEYSKASEYVICMEEHIDGLNGTITIPLYYFYNSLTQLALYANAEAPDQRKIFKKVVGNQKKMKYWAKHAPMNYQHKYLLVEAERLSVTGKKKQAEKHYRQAVELAKQNGYLNEEALILERTAIFYASIEENQLAAETMLKARTAYEKWGAMAKVRVLDKDFAHLLIDRYPHIGLKKETPSDTLDQEHQYREKDLDLAAVMKATQAISSEIVLEKLLAQLMRIIIENAGAQAGLLILKKEEGLRVEATARADSDDVDANQSLPVEESDALSLDIVRYVDRTGEPVVIHKATENSQFYTDPHVLEHRPKSILCMPILLKDKITGVLYLENNLANNVFTRERIEILNILLAQAAISLENALLYENLKKEVAVRKQAEERLLHLATALEQAAEAILITDMGGTITYANPVCEEIFGYNQEEIIGKNTRIFRSGQQGQGFFEDIWKIISCGKIWSGRMSSKKKDESIRELEVTASPIKDREGNIISFVSVSRDVTHEIEMEKELRQAQKMEAMGTLAGGIAHDFNNILTAIMGYSELATSQSHPESPIHQNLEQVIASAKRAKDLVRQILAFSRKTDQEARPVQLQIIVKEALKMLRASLPATIEIQVDIEDVSGYVEADPTQIQQVVVNLCTNSAQSMESGGVLMVRLEDYIVAGKNHHLYPEVIPGQYLRFIVRDNGEGIDNMIIERIFEPFFTTKEPGKGTGMGLAMVHGIVKRCKGAIRVASEPGQGTEFCVLFPIYEGKLPEEEKPSSVNASPGLERIMFVDDEKTLVTLMEDGLQRIGYQMHTETDSNTALKVFKQDPDKFDLVITDRTMPKLTGIELSKALIQIRPDIPIILYSGLMEELSPEMLQAAGIRCSLSKPLMLKQLAEAIRQVLDNKEVEVAE
jgi:PAS domain S-box-containing protein